MERRVALYALIVCGGNVLRQFSKQSDEGIAKSVECVVSGGTHVVVGARENMSVKEVLSRDACKGGHPRVKMVGEGAVFWEEGRVKEVPNTPKEDVVGIRIGLSCRTNGTHDACVLSVSGHTE